MSCDVDLETCKDLVPGQYVMVSSPTGKYTDCYDADIYARGSDSDKGRPIGTYCLLPP